MKIPVLGHIWIALSFVSFGSLFADAHSLGHLRYSHSSKADERAEWDPICVQCIATGGNASILKVVLRDQGAVALRVPEGITQLTNHIHAEVLEQDRDQMKNLVAPYHPPPNAHEAHTKIAARLLSQYHNTKGRLNDSLLNKRFKDLESKNQLTAENVASYLDRCATYFELMDFDLSAARRVQRLQGINHVENPLETLLTVTKISELFLRSIHDFHSMNLIHTDIKLDNVLMNYIGPYQYEVKIGDYADSFIGDQHGLVNMKYPSGTDAFGNEPFLNWLDRWNDKMNMQLKVKNSVDLALQPTFQIDWYHDMFPSLHVLLDLFSVHFGLYTPVNDDIEAFLLPIGEKIKSAEATVSSMKNAKISEAWTKILHVISQTASAAEYRSISIPGDEKIYPKLAALYKDLSEVIESEIDKEHRP